VNYLTEKLLSIQDLQTCFFTSSGVVKAVDHVSLDIARGETLGIVGESGSGKTTVALSIMRLVPSPPGKIIGGRIDLAGYGNLVELDETELRKIRGSVIAMSFQDPMTYLNPVLTVGRQVVEAILLHNDMTRSDATARAIQIMRHVGIGSPEMRAREYPHQMSGGMRQRILLAMAISCQPRLLIADEPTTALDVITQAGILRLLKNLKDELGISLLIVSHDLGVVANLCDRIGIMYAGHMMEIGNTAEVFERSRHPYTRALLESIPRVDTGKKRLAVIDGAIPRLTDLPNGCVFNPRCAFAQPECKVTNPPLEIAAEDHKTACLLWKQIYSKEEVHLDR
jgi:oligopeptide/dipeptide ABC transporter ATP-binding protein